jgi:tRNA G10  N-methylase Trm11
MHQYLFIHGKNSRLSKYEIECVFENAVVFQADAFSLVEMEEMNQSVQDRLGGTVKIAQVVETDIVDEVERNVPEGKIHFGLSLYDAGKGKVSEYLHEMKDWLGLRGRNARYINKDFKNVSSGQLEQTRLLEKGIDIVVCIDGNKKYIGRTVVYQNIEAYSKRDYERPVRDAKVGMLPPKLAQLMINFARPTEGGKIVDPFCGLGTIPMEALLMGYKVVAADVKGRMKEATEKNCAWLMKEFKVDPSLELHTYQHDATKSFNQKTHEFYVITEGYLGPPQERFPTAHEQVEVFSLLDKINRPFFQHISNAMTKGSRIVFSFPFFQSGSKKTMYPTEMIQRYLTSGFEVIKGNGELMYSRAKQIVGRDIVVWEKR